MSTYTPLRLRGSYYTFTPLQLFENGSSVYHKACRSAIFKRCFNACNSYQYGQISMILSFLLALLKMVNGKWTTYIALLSKALYNVLLIHPFIHRWQRKPCKAPTCPPGAVRDSLSCSRTLRHLAQEEPGIEPGTFRSQDSRSTSWATVAPTCFIREFKQGPFCGYGDVGSRRCRRSPQSPLKTVKQIRQILVPAPFNWQLRFPWWQVEHKHTDPKTKEDTPLWVRKSTTINQ